MSFQTLLKAAVLAPKTFEDALKRLETARAEVEAASKNHDECAAALRRADKALHDFLAERGTHYVPDPSGTVTLYRACAQGRGWVAEHPIPGTEPEPEPEPQAQLTNAKVK